MGVSISVDMSAKKLPAVTRIVFLENLRPDRSLIEPLRTSSFDAGLPLSVPGFGLATKSGRNGNSAHTTALVPPNILYAFSPFHGAVILEDAWPLLMPGGPHADYRGVRRGT